MVISQFDIGNFAYDVVSEEGVYNVYCNGDIVQPNHDAEAVIRYLSHVIHALAHENEQLR